MNRIATVLLAASAVLFAGAAGAQSEAEVVAAKPLADLDAKWAASEAAATAFTRMAYNSFKRS